MAGEDRLPSDALAAAGLAAALVVTGSAIGDTTLGILITFVDYLLLVYAMFRLPLRTSLMTLMFFVMTLPNPTDCTPGTWRPPFFTAGAILLTHLNAVDRSLTWLSSASFSGLDLILVALFIIHLFRNGTGSRIDRVGQVPGPDVLPKLAKVSLLAIAYVWINGMLRGGDFKMSLWQLNNVMYLPCLFLLFNVGLRGPRDHAALAKVVLLAATYKALLAVYVMKVIKTFVETPGSEPIPMPHATSHQDSILFAVAFVLVVALFLERAIKRRKWLFALLLVLIGLGMQANNRRLAWVQVGLVLLMLYIVSADSPIKRNIRRAVMIGAPIIAIYVLAGWNSGGGSLFKPVRILRSVADAKSDGSSYWRELENYDLISTIKLNPIFGTGYGHGYEEVIVLPAISYDLERYAPHNSILGLWAFCGYLGYAGLTMLWAGGVYFAVRAYHASEAGSQRAAALVSFGAVLIYMVQSWGDLGLGSPIGVFTISAAIAVAGKLAVSTGEWSTKGGKRPPGGSPHAPRRVHVNGGPAGRTA